MPIDNLSWERINISTKSWNTEIYSVWNSRMNWELSATGWCSGLHSHLIARQTCIQYNTRAFLDGVCIFYSCIRVHMYSWALSRYFCLLPKVYRIAQESKWLNQKCFHYVIVFLSWSCERLCTMHKPVFSWDLLQQQHNPKCNDVVQQMYNMDKCLDGW